MDEVRVFLQANKDLVSVIDKIQEHQWTLRAPAEMSWQPDQTIRDLVNYHIYDDAWVSDVLAGKTAAEVGDRYEALRTTKDTAAEYRKHNKLACDAVRGFRELDRIVHLSYGDFTAREYLTHITLFRGLRNYDFSKFLGFRHNLSPELVEGLWEIIFPQAALLREMHVIGAEIPVPAEAPLLDRLLGLTGRT
jgi:hypothetical protein